MDTPDKNRISAVSFSNYEDSPVFQYINDLSPIEPVKPSRPENILHSLALTITSPSSLFCSPQINSYRDSRFSIKRHRSIDLSSPVVLIGETVKDSPDALEGVKIPGLCEEQLNCRAEHLNLAIELANSLNNRRDGCDIQMVSCDKVTMDPDNEIGRCGSRELSDDLCRQFNDPLDFDADSDGVFQTDEMEAENGHGAGNTMVDVAAIDSSDKSQDKEETGHQPSSKQRSVRRRCLTFDMGGSYQRIPLRDSTNDLSLHFTSINKAPSPEKCLDISKQDTDEILLIPQTIGLHLNGFINSSVSSDPSKFIFKDGRIFPYDSTTFHHNTEDEFSTPVPMKRDLVTCDNKIMEAPKRSMAEESFDKHMPAENRKLSQGLEELGNCKRCSCRKSKCLKLYCECFAAGLYCVEPCNCQNCFNKPIHDDIVGKTRELIEARNPLAFAPKVVSSSGSAIDIWDENSKTPASARHLRGCNCRKSGCSKKYCDCYMMGVGCSSSCRCIGCKNIYGHRNEQCDGEFDAVTINDEAKDNDDHDYASSQNGETSNSERRNCVVFGSSVTFRSLASL